MWDTWGLAVVTGGGGLAGRRLSHLSSQPSSHGQGSSPPSGTPSCLAAQGFQVSLSRCPYCRLGHDGGTAVTVSGPQSQTGAGGQLGSKPPGSLRSREAPSLAASVSWLAYSLGPVRDTESTLERIQRSQTEIYKMQLVKKCSELGAILLSQAYKNICVAYML